jgi:hypothetical protein
LEEKMKNYTYELYFDEKGLSNFQANSLEELKQKYIDYSVEEEEFIEAELIELVDDEGNVSGYEDLEDFVDECREEFQRQLGIEEIEREGLEDIIREFKSMR